MENLNAIPTINETDAKLVEEVLNAEEFENKVESSSLSNYFKSGESLKNSVSIFGQTEEEIEKEFKNYKANKVFSKLNYLILDNAIAKSVLRKECETAISYGFKSVTVLPTAIRFCKEYTLGSKMQVNALISYPFGEDNFKVKLTAVKDAFRLGADGVTIALSVVDVKNAIFKNITAEFKKIIKISRNRAVNVIIDTYKLSPTDIQNAINAVLLAGKISSVIFSESSLDKSISTHVLKEAIKVVNGKTEVGVNCNLATAEDTVSILSLGVSNILSEKCNDIVLDALKRLSL